MPDVQEVFSMATQKVRPDEGFVDRQHGHQRRRARNRRNSALALVAVLGIAAAVFAIRLAGEDRSQPATEPTLVPGAAPEVDYILDLSTGEMTPLPDAIVGETDAASYAVSPDGGRIAYRERGEEGNGQIFVANLDGTSVQQVTHDPSTVGAGFPAWSPDGTSIAYEGYGEGDVRNFFVVDLASGVTSQVTFETRSVSGTQFTPDGSSLVYAGGTKGQGIRLAPIDGGKHTLLVRRETSNGSLSPDGAFLTYNFTEFLFTSRWIANGDGTDPRVLTEGFLECSSAGAWSPDASRIACSDGVNVIVVDVKTGEKINVAEGGAPAWVDDHTLIIPV